MNPFTDAMEVIPPTTTEVPNAPSIGKQRKGTNPKIMVSSVTFKLRKNTHKNSWIFLSSTGFSFKSPSVIKAYAFWSLSGFLMKIKWLIKPARIIMIKVIIKSLEYFVLNHFHSSK